MVNHKKIIFYLSVAVFFTGCAVPSRKPPVIPPPPVAGEIKPSAPIKEIIIKIGIIESTDRVSIEGEDDFTIINIKTGEKFNMPADDIYILKTVKDKIIFGKKQFASDIKIIPRRTDQKITVDGKRYKGNIILRINNRKKLAVINELGLEEYICGIMTKEVSPSWSFESLNAQAVVARTYAIKNLGKHASSGFDLCSQTHCQVYGGFGSEDERSNKAVYNTAGEILKYNGEIINALYHSSCGGRTEDVKNVWNDSKTENPEYLMGVKCGFCEKDKWYNWSASISLKMIGSNLRSFGYKVGDVKKIKTAGRTSSDRVKEVLIEHSKGALWLRSNRFRMAMNPNVIRSTNFTVKIKSGVAYFRGHGWGHGVGMCQWGAKGMAEDGWNYKKILKHYYLGTEIINEEK
ncbi:MAG: SpoIID/LytB domain-containing protein [Elusimicrobia bacterium]|nr:SpoIID/LytB domain-containing protein [Elusimicrobiota bacterium]